MNGSTPIEAGSERSERAVIPYGRQDITEADLEAVRRVLLSDFLTQGPVVPEFESRMAALVGARFAVASNSATSSLHLACLALGVSRGDLVWTTPITFVASANCARYCGAEVDFVDIDKRSYNISVASLEQKLFAAEKAGRLPKVVIPVHLAGHPADMEPIWRLSRQYGFAIIEDASHAVGGRYRETPVGSCQYSDITIFSFHPVKIITTGEGGMALTNDPVLARKMAQLNSHGITRDPAEMIGTPDGPWYYQQVDLGYNYRMTDVQAALGLSQLERLAEYSARRHVLAARYDELLKAMPVTTPWRDPRDYSGFHLYIIRLNLSLVKHGHREIFEAMRAAGILVNLHYIPVYRQPDYASFGFETDSFPESECYYSEAMTLPLFPKLSEDDQERVVSVLQSVLQ